MNIVQTSYSAVTWLNVVFLQSSSLPTLFPAMDFLKSAVASAISKGPPFPYTFGDRLDLDQSFWTLHNGTKRVGSFRPGRG